MTIKITTRTHHSLCMVTAGGLTTSNGQIIDENGKTVVLKGFALSGFEISLTMSGNLLKGTDSIAHDWDTVMYRYTPISLPD